MLHERKRKKSRAQSLVEFTLVAPLLLLIIALGAIYRLFSKDYAEEADNGALTQYVGLVVVLSVLAWLCASAARYSN